MPKTQERTNVARRIIQCLSLLIAFATVFGCHSENETYQSETLVIRKISDHVYQHVSFLESESFGKVPCNGMVIYDNDEAVIFDTPSDENTSVELIKWVENSLNCRVKAVIATHFHADCLGGLDVFHNHEIHSYANNLTIALAKASDKALPQTGFNDMLELTIGNNKKVLVEYLGEGHTKDNVIGYFPDEKILFGGCLIKELGAGKGNLEDANTAVWPLTVSKIRAKYEDVKVVVPGHGKPGGAELLDYTIDLFKQN